MPAAQTLPALRRDLLDLLTDDLAAALTALRDLLPEGADKHGSVLALQGRLKDANKERIRNTIAPDEYQRRVDTVRAACYDLIGSLEPADLEPPVVAPRPDGKPARREGSVLYRVPHRMPLQKPVVCTIRVAMDDDAILDDLVLDDDVRLRPRVEVSDMMRADLLDPDGGAVFAIRPLSEAEQLVREQGYTQWLFRVTPLVTGEHQLLVKVSMMEYNAHLGRYVPREVSVLETVTIVTGEAVTDEAEMKATGERVALAPRAATPPPTPPQGGRGDVEPLPPPSPVRRPSAAMRVVAFALIFLMAGSAGVWAVTPPPTRDWWVAGLRNTAEAYDEYIRKYGNNTEPKVLKRLETAYARRAERSGKVTDCRSYLEKFPRGEYREKLNQKMEQLEIRAFERLQQRPDSVSLRLFLQNFPESRRRDTAMELLGRNPLLNRLERLDSLNRRSERVQLRENIRLLQQKKDELRDLPAKDANSQPDRPRSGLEMVPVQGGTFTMGCVEGRDRECEKDEIPAHLVTLSGFQIGRYEVTQADWRSVMGSDPPELGFPGCDDCPVESVSWNDVQGFLKKLNARSPGKNYRLPTEAEWEYAARGGHRMPKDATRMTEYAGSNEIGKVAWHEGNSGQKTHPVGGKVPNVLGLYDMSGNVYEWCSDWYEDYSKAAQRNPSAPKTGLYRVARGGAWIGRAGDYFVSARDGSSPDYRDNIAGFRLASSLQ